MITRRQVFVPFGAGILINSSHLMAQSRAQKAVRVAYLSAAGRTADGKPPATLIDALVELGYVEGKNIAYIARFAEGKAESLPVFAAELVRLGADIIVTQGGPATLAAKLATTQIPIIMAAAAGDAVATGLIESLARPGGNVTGMSDENVGLNSKRMQLLKETIPKAARIAIIWNANDQGMRLRFQAMQKAAEILKVKVDSIEVRKSNDFAGAFETIGKLRPDAMLVVTDGLTNSNKQQVLEGAEALHIPAMYELGQFVDSGGLMSYGPSLADGLRRAAVYIDQIVKGAKVVDLPAEQPTRFYLILNLTTAAKLGLTFPPTLRLMADEVIGE
jgi:putative ABC transport system substrate-binding protein